VTEADLVEEDNEIEFVMNANSKEINFLIDLRDSYDSVKSCVIKEIEKVLL